MDLKEFFRATDGMPADARRRLSEINSDWQWRRLLYYAKPTIAMTNSCCNVSLIAVYPPPIAMPT